MVQRKRMTIGLLEIHGAQTGAITVILKCRGIEKTIALLLRGHPIRFCKF